MGSYPDERDPPHPLPESVRMEIIQMGLPDDGYDYTQHLREIGSGSNVGFKTCFIPSSKPKKSLQTDVKVYDSKGLPIPQPEIPFPGEKTKPRSRSRNHAGYEYSNGPKFYQQSIIDREILEQLEYSEGGESGDELEDDFVLFANSDDAVGGNDGSTNHRNRISTDDGISNDNETDINLKGDFRNKGEQGGIFSDASEDDDDDADEEDGGGDDDFGKNEKKKSETQNHGEKNRRPMRLIDEQFEELALREYNDSESDIADAEYDEDFQSRVSSAQGRFDISKFESIIDDEYEQERENRRESVITLDEIRNVLVGKYDVNEGKKNVIYITENEERTEGASDEENAAEEDKDLKAEKEGIEIKQRIKKLYSYVIPEDEVHSEEMQVIRFVEDEAYEEFDCESIISTYSNLDNHPGRITDEFDGKKKKERSKKDKDGNQNEMNGGVIKLVGREKLPLNFLIQSGRVVMKEKKDNANVSSKERTSGPRVESLEEKKQRKSAVKEERRKARMEKKNLKRTYTNESRRGQTAAAKSTPQGIHLS